jgi:hypothetical protein
MRPRTQAQKRTIDPDRRGYDTGRKARAAGRPEPLHVDKDGNPHSQEWIEWMRKGYYGDRAGRPTQGEEPRVKVTCTIDRELRDKAIELGISRSQALEAGLKLLMQKAKLPQPQL